jgi:predicted small metal-binding protein
VFTSKEMMSYITRNYCVDCEWAVSIDNHSREELAAQAVAHAVETGHDIDSADRAVMPDIDSSDRSDSDDAADGHVPA